MKKIVLLFSLVVMVAGFQNFSHAEDKAKEKPESKKESKGQQEDAVQLTPQQKKELSGLKQKMDEARAAFKTEKDALDAKKKEVPDGDHKALAAKVKEAKTEFQAKKKDYRAKREQLGLIKAKPKADDKKNDKKKPDEKAKDKDKAKEKKPKPEKPEKKAKDKKKPAAELKAVTVAQIKYPGDLELKDGTTLTKVTIHQIGGSHIVVSDSKYEKRKVLVKNLTEESKQKLGL
jgi:hypothetical protein